MCVGGGGEEEGTKAGAKCWPMAVDWHALWQYCAQTARARCTLRSCGARLGPWLCSYLRNSHFIYHSCVLRWVLTEPAN